MTRNLFLFGLLTFILPVSVARADLAAELLRVSGTSGGLVVHLGCADGHLTAALGADNHCLVHGLAGDWSAVETARAHVHALGVYGRISIDRFSGETLPYEDNVVNLLVSTDSETAVPVAEILRVLTSGGVAMVKAGSAGLPAPWTDSDLPGWQQLEKPWPRDIDEWTHYMHAPDGNQVAADRVVGPPQRVQWLAKPFWGRDHRYGNMTAMVTAGGKLFYVGNDVEPSIETLPDRPCLTARDAFNGVHFWTHPIYPQSYSDRLDSRGDPDDYILFEPAFPMELKVAAHGDRLYLAFGRNGEVQVLDATTGELLQTYPGTEKTEELLCSDEVLLTVAPVADHALKDRPRNMAALNDAVFTRRRGSLLRAIDPGTGAVLWEHDTSADGGLKVSPVVKDGHVLVIVGDRLVRMSLATGERDWQRPIPKDVFRQPNLRSVIYIKGPSVYDRLIATDEVVLLAFTPRNNPKARDTALAAFDAQTGEFLWRFVGLSPERAGTSAFVVGDLVWTHAADQKLLPLVGLDLKTGEVRKKIDATPTFDVTHHHRCYGNRATDRFLLVGRRGVEFIDFASGENRLHHWVRGKCRFGVLPANGLLYSLPHNCSCYPFSTMKGYTALAAGEPAASTDEPARLEKGPAYGQVAPAPAATDPWPMLRHDGRRRGAAPFRVAHANLKIHWSASVGGRPTAATAGNGRVLIATPESHQVHALAADDGAHLWSFTAGGQVDSPPALHGGRVLFGSADGHAYCLRARDGALVWRFRAAPQDRRMVAYGQLASKWPLHGALLVRNGVVYCSAGRSSLLDGGIALYGLDAETGAIVAENVLHDPYTEAEAAMLRNDGRGYAGEIAVLQDILVADETHVCLRQMKLDDRLEVTGHSDQLISGNGLLHPAWFSRIGWYFGVPNESRRSNADSSKFDFRESPRQGQYLVFDQGSTYSVRLFPNVGKFARSFVPAAGGYRIFADDNRSGKTRWSIEVPIRVEAMLAAGGETLFLGGSPDMVDRADPWGAVEGRKGGLLWAVSTQDGTKLAELPLPHPPVFDGLIAAGGKLILSTVDGRIMCIGGG